MTDFRQANSRVACNRKIERGGFFVSALFLAVAIPGIATAQAKWNLDALSTPPATHSAPGFESGGVQALFYEGLDWRGKPTRVFAWYGHPDDDEKAPAMVLVHGGGGTAFARWVRLWTSRGYAAIAMDLCGSVPRQQGQGWERHQHAGPPGWGGFDQVNTPPADQWTYQAVADVVLAHSLLRFDNEHVHLAVSRRDHVRVLRTELCGPHSAFV